MALILGVICIVAYAFSKGWFGSTTRSPQMEESNVSVSQRANELGANEKVALDAEASK